MNKKYIYQGHYIKKHLGQYFLTDNNIIRNIVNALNIKNNQKLIEIGPGLGALTIPISKYTNNITVIEIDNNLANKLSNIKELKDKITIFKENILQIDLNKIIQNKYQNIRLFGNLPYNISIPIIFYLFNYINHIYDMHFMLQKEVVDRLIALPNNKIYGKLSIMTQYHCDISPILIVPPTSFKPIPKVNSTFVRLIPHKTIPYINCDTKLLKMILKTAFNKRRKFISNSLKYMFTKEELINLDIDINSRAENISINQYCKLSNFLYKMKRKL